MFDSSLYYFIFYSKVSGFDPPKPITSFGHFGFDEQLMHYIRKTDYSKPTPIQAQGVPIALKGRDIIGIAKTGSGKTAAFVWPLLVHIMDQVIILIIFKTCNAHISTVLGV